MLTEAQKKKVIARLRRAEGQVAAVRKMVEQDKYCVDVLLQISAARAALGKVGEIILGSHIETCVADAFIEGNQRERTEKIEELLDVFRRYGALSGK
jgi:DNA-binding FrmR family transcriptional regulator